MLIHPYLLLVRAVFKGVQEEEHLFGQIGVVGKLREETRERVVVHQQGCRRDVECGGDHREPVNGDRAPAVLVTAATTLAWAWYLISTHPEVERRLYAEVDTVLGGRAPTASDLSALTYIRQIIDETLRLYPAAWLVSRSPNTDDAIGGYHVPAGAMIIVCPYIAHRNIQVWEHPDAFNPDRFTPQCATGRPRHAYWPFGMGARMCIGNYLEES